VRIAWPGGMLQDELQMPAGKKLIREADPHDTQH